jgi:hypothetical protein
MLLSDGYCLFNGKNRKMGDKINLQSRFTSFRPFSSLLWQL